MLKSRFKYQIIASIFLLLAITFSFYWEMWIGKWFLIIISILILMYLVLIFVFFYQLIKSIQNKFRERTRNTQIIILVFVLTIVTIKPFGIINFEKFYGKDVLIAYSEGVAGCMQRIKLKDNNNYIYYSFCFGSERKIGKYEIKNDTVFFNEKDRNPYDFGVIENEGVMFFKQDLLKPRGYRIEFNLLK